MGLFKRNNKILDLSENYNLQEQSKRSHMKSKLKELGNRDVVDLSPSIVSPQVASQENTNSGILGFFSNIGAGNRSNSIETIDDSNESSEDKRKKLAKRLADMTDRLEEVSNKIYRIEQRLDVIERKVNVTKY